MEELIYIVEKDAASLAPEDITSSWHEWYATANNTKYVFGYQKTIWNNSVDESLLESSNTILAQYLKKAKNFLIEASLDYAKFFNINNISYSSMDISKYIPGKAMGPHVDSDGAPETNAVISAILYLNDDYEGGELYFPNQNITLKPTSGTVVIFPSISPFLHQSLILKNGFKYIIALFWEKNNDI